MAVVSDNQKILKELESLREELKMRDDRIERLEKVLLFLIGSKENPNYLYQLPDNMLKNALSPHAAERVGRLLEGYESVEKVLEEFLSICEKRLGSNVPDEQTLAQR